MRVPNLNTLWGTVIADELAKGGVTAVCTTPGSRSTPLTVAFADHPRVRTYSHLDERSAAYFALGRAKRTGRVMPLVCTSGTAAANFHPAVVEADTAEVPMLLLTADRPPELQDSGANQTIDQEHLYGTAVRLYRTLPEPGASDRKLRSLRTTLCRAIETAEGGRGPVHLNVPFRKPLAPTVETEEVTPSFVQQFPLAAEGREGPFVTVDRGETIPSDRRIDRLADGLAGAERPLIVAGPNDDIDPTPIVALAEALGAPIFADPLSGLRFGPHVGDGVPICGGYDAYLEAGIPGPDLVLRIGASPTSKTLRHYLREADCRQVVVARRGWSEAEFTATDLVRADPSRLARALADRLGRSPGDWSHRFRRLEAQYWDLVDVADHWEGGILQDIAALTPAPATVFVSNSMPVRDLDRFGQPRAAELAVFGNRGASGIDGIISTALGVGHTGDEPLVVVAGDIAFYHDMNGLLAIDRLGVDATIIVVNNDGGGIFRRLPIATHPTFEEYFLTPHNLDFGPAADLYELPFARTDDRHRFRDIYRDAVATTGPEVIEVRVDSAESHALREELQAEVLGTIGD